MPGPLSTTSRCDEIGPVVVAHAHLDGFPGAVLQRVRHQVGDNLIETQRVHPGGYRTVGADRDGARTSVPGDLESAHHLPDRLHDVDVANVEGELRAMNVGDVQQRVYQVAHPRRRRIAPRDLRLHRGAVGRFLLQPPSQHLEVEQQRRQRRLELVRCDRVEQIAQAERLLTVAQHGAFRVEVLLCGQIEDEADDLILAFVE